ncbi:lactonase family protein [Mucilaginibacter daejeonensis]|uniref:lactonase family protein n=1 Tax=Mucilaginibacter daejeonensis TaxID=398049 RepID=UPI001D17C6D5|nr:lactonase family protein [Mucilaginibacter daejeonensis]UEG52800.1 lactonase family protein [Mucilaginibacter daejeonensis]
MKKLLLLLCLAPALLVAQPKPPKTLDLLIGTYTTNVPDGIYVYRFYTESGRLVYLNRTSGVDNPSYLCVAPNGKFVYSVNEIGNDRTGSVSAFSFEPKVGKIELINKQPSGAGPCYISVDKDQKHIFSANYAGGSLSVFPLKKDGSIAPASQTIQDQGNGPNKARQEKAHVHTAMLSPDEKHLLYTDLGTDKVNIYRYHSGQEKPLTPSDPASFSLPGGEGPRHIDFSLDKRYMYVVSEMGAHVFAYTYNNGNPKMLQKVSMMEDGSTKEAGGADIHVSPDGRFLYATNRGTANEIVVYAINAESGLLTFIERHDTGGNHPRNFVIDPAGNYLLVANKNSNNIVVYKINHTTGKLTPNGNTVEIDSPTCLKFTPAQ